MSVIESIAANIGKKTKYILDFDDNTEEIVIYGAMNLIQTTVSFFLVIVIGFIFGVIYESLVFTIIVSILKKYSGGAHASSPGRCLFIGSVISIGLSLLISKILCKQSVWGITVIGILCIAISLYIIIKKAPVDSEKKPITSNKMRQRLKRDSIVTILICSSVMVMVLLIFKISGNLVYIKIFECTGLGTLWQSFTLTKPAIEFLHKIDSLLPF
ncbi:accessory gene regulator ArgB-like protein [Clostridium beijerinckii]|uniref:Accessory gene regulator B n=1 Tax=Clostridium beijerinckii TaxID=1520 RepID=A0AAE5H4X5_CLOBE|nr:accessory gene regulator B family protein [Clostridium beijerinckii]ALB45904.1 membrane protein involved in AIP processing and secretion activity [Clostridium beijerinckii NRRL B-598]NSB14456.1 accessory gene regulator B [Clostridium beijerinckii]OOM33084.1 accessory protein regulator protein B [Clostridium beijerinckii]